MLSGRARLLEKLVVRVRNRPRRWLRLRASLPSDRQRPRLHPGCIASASRLTSALLADMRDACSVETSGVYCGRRASHCRRDVVQAGEGLTSSAWRRDDQTCVLRSYLGVLRRGARVDEASRERRPPPRPLAGSRSTVGRDFFNSLSST